MSVHPIIKNFTFWALLLFVVASGLFCDAPARAESPADIAGVMTRWETTSSSACQHTYNDFAKQRECPRSLMFTITPALNGLTLQRWLATLASAGVNTGVIYVLPSTALAKTPSIGEQAWEEYNQYIYFAPSRLDSNQKRIILEVGLAISKHDYTPEQRDFAILSFFRQLQRASPNTAPIKFILDERTWFINHIGSDGRPVPQSRENIINLEHTYSRDIAGLVQRLNSGNLNQWVSGVRLSEYAAKDWNLMGPVMVDLVTEINEQTSGWLKTRIFIGAGGGWGQRWNGVNNMKCPTSTGWQFPACTGAFPFFRYMSTQVGYFAFGDKFMEFGAPQEYMVNDGPSGLKYSYINGEIADFCQENTLKYTCQEPATPTIKDWEAFLEDDTDGLGFSDLISFMLHNAQAYPHLANVIFEGDNADSIATMIGPNCINGAKAIANLFNAAKQGGFQNVEKGTTIVGQSLGTWTGKIFLDGFDDQSTVPRPGFYGDAGYSMFDTNYLDFMFSPTQVQIIPLQNAMNNWLHWP